MFKRHPIYLFIHIALGVIGYYYPEVLYSAIGYQIAQYLFDVRFFLFEATILQGNSINHTIWKIGEIGLGYTLAMVYNTSFKVVFSME